MAAKFTNIDVDGVEVKITNPDKMFFADIGRTKLDLVQYYLAVGAGALRGVHSRPTVLKRFPDGAASEPFFQKRVPASRPPWLRTAVVAFPSGRTAEELCPADLAHVIWAINLGCIDLNPWPVRRWDLSHPDELRVDLDPSPGVAFADVRRVALGVHELLDELGIAGYPKTSGSRGIHINVRIATRWEFNDVRRAAVALAREMERRMPTVATSKWWKEERGNRVFIDYNQNARDRTVASVYSVRPNPRGMVSCPVTWNELGDVELEDFTIDTVPPRYASGHDPDASIDDRAYAIDPLLELAARDEREGLGDAPWPPNFPKMPGEGRRVQPSRRRADGPD